MDRHFGDVVVPVHDLGYGEDLVGQQLSDFFSVTLSLALAVQRDQFQAHGPHLPGDAVGLEQPPAPLPLLEELQTDLALAGALVAPQLFAEAADLPLQRALEQGGRTADVSQVDKIAIYVRVTDRTDRVAALGRVEELAVGAVEQHRVEYAGDGLVSLSALHFQIEHLGSGVHSFVDQQTYIIK